MNLREALQIELWSKRTSRKIFVWVGVVVGIAVVGSETWRRVEQNWLTPGERTAAKAGLEQIDKLQDFESISDQDFGAAMKQAQSKTDAAERAAWTARDRFVVSKLMSYQLLTLIDRLHARKRELLEQQNLSTAKFERDWNEKIDPGRLGSRTSVRLELHQALD